MRTVETFYLGTSPISGESQELIVVAKDGTFSHAHYFVRYPNYVHRSLYSKFYQTPNDVTEEVLSKCTLWPNKILTRYALKRVGCIK